MKTILVQVNLLLLISILILFLAYKSTRVCRKKDKTQVNMIQIGILYYFWVHKNIKFLREVTAFRVVLRRRVYTLSSRIAGRTKAKLQWLWLIVLVYWPQIGRQTTFPCATSNLLWTCAVLVGKDIDGLLFKKRDHSIRRCTGGL